MKSLAITTANLLGMLLLAVFVLADPPPGQPCSLPSATPCVPASEGTCTKNHGNPWPCCNSVPGACCDRQCWEAWCEGDCTNYEHFIEYGTSPNHLGLTCLNGDCKDVV
jgi:hypothetical protein